MAMASVGVVSEIGPGSVGKLEPGDGVMAPLGGGGYAERLVVPAALAMKIPHGLGFEQAAAIPEAFLTAREALVAAGRIAARESVLIHAAAGGVGSAAVQLARALGARVFATAGGPTKCQWVRALGA